MNGRRVAITGLGIYSGFGPDLAAFRAGLREARCAIRPIHAIPTDRLTAKVACQIDGYVPADHFDRNQIQFYDKVTQLTLVAGRQATAQAGLTAADFATLGHRVGAIHAASPGQVTIDEAYHAFYALGQGRVHPLSLPRVMGSAQCSALSIEFKLHGPCFGVASACASATHAIGLAFQMIRGGMMDVCLTGGSDVSLVPGYIKCWEALRVLSPEPARPFSRDRLGLSLGEAATVLVLEAWEHAVARGAAILGEIVGFGMNADGADLTAPNAESAAAAMRLALADAGLDAAAIGFVSAHGTGTRLNDLTETKALKAVFGGRVPPVSSVKSQVGHCLNGAGGVETIATALALADQLLPATVNFREPDPECDIDCIPNVPRPASFDFALKNSLGFGGVNAVLALRRVAAGRKQDEA